MTAKSVKNKATLLFMVLLTGCYGEAPPVPKIDALEGVYQSPGCQEIEIANGRIILSSSEGVEVAIVRIKGDIYLVPSKGMIVEDHECIIGHYKWPQRLGVSRDLSTISILTRSQDEIVYFSKRMINNPN